MIRYKYFLGMILFFTGIAFASSDEIGVVGDINPATREIIVNINSGINLKMGEQLEVVTGKGIVILEVKFPMMTVAKCTLKNKSRVSGINKGMIVYRYGMSSTKDEKKPVAEQEKEVLAEDKSVKVPDKIYANNVGCGLGTVLFRGKRGKLYEIIAVTTNYTAVNSTFAITSGTSGYREGAVIGVNIVEEYIAQNMDNLASDIAKGDGEYLNTLATLMKVENRELFKNKLKKNFNNIYISKNVTSKEVAANIKKYS